MHRYTSDRRSLLSLFRNKLERLLRDGSRLESDLAGTMEVGSLRFIMVCSRYSCLTKKINALTKRSTDMFYSTKPSRGFSDGSLWAHNSDKCLVLAGKYSGSSRSP